MPTKSLCSSPLPRATGNYNDVSGDPESIVKKQIAPRQKSFAKLRAAHVAEHQALFRRVSLDLGRARR